MPNLYSTKYLAMSRTQQIFYDNLKRPTAKAYFHQAVFQFVLMSLPYTPTYLLKDKKVDCRLLKEPWIPEQIKLFQLGT